MKPSAEEMRREFEIKCGIYDGAIYSIEKHKYIPAYYSETAYADTNRQNSLFAGWQSAISSQQAELENWQLVAEQWRVDAVDWSRKNAALVEELGTLCKEYHADTPTLEHISSLEYSIAKLQGEQIRKLEEKYTEYETAAQCSATIKNEKISAASKYISELSSQLSQANDTIAALQAKIVEADKQEPALWMFTVDGRYYTAKSEKHAQSMLNHPDTHLYPDKPEDFPLSPLFTRPPITSQRELKLLAVIEQMRKALNKLARLGNGESFGNSVGNVIAQDALALMPDITQRGSDSPSPNPETPLL